MDENEDMDMGNDSGSRAAGAPAAREVVFRFGDLDPETRAAFERFCAVREAEARATEESARAQREAQENIHFKEVEELRSQREQEAEAARARRPVLEARAQLEAAEAEAQAKVVAARGRLEVAKLDAETEKLRQEGRHLRDLAQVEVVSNMLEVAWPRLESLGRGFLGLVREEAGLVKEELRLIAGRNPATGERG